MDFLYSQFRATTTFKTSPPRKLFITPQKTLLISNYSQLSFSANPQMYFLSPLTWPLWTFHINRITECVLICVWLLLFGEMCLRIIHAVPRVNTSCPLRLDSIPVCGWITFSIIQLTDEPSRFSPFAPMNNAAICTGVQVSASARVFNSAGFIPRSGIASSQGNSLFDFSRIYQTVFRSVCIALHFRERCMRVCHNLATTCYFLVWSFVLFFNN